MTTIMSIIIIIIILLFFHRVIKVYHLGITKLMNMLIRYMYVRDDNLVTSSADLDRNMNLNQMGSNQMTNF